MKKIRIALLILLLLGVTAYIYQAHIKSATVSAPEQTATPPADENTPDTASKPATGVDSSKSAQAANAPVPLSTSLQLSIPLAQEDETEQVSRAEKLLDTPADAVDTAARAEKLETVDRAEKLIGIERKPLDRKFIAEEALIQWKTIHQQAIQNVRETKEVLSPSAPR